MDYPAKGYPQPLRDQGQEIVRSGTFWLRNEVPGRTVKVENLRFLVNKDCGSQTLLQQQVPHHLRVLRALWLNSADHSARVRSWRPRNQRQSDGHSFERLLALIDAEFFRNRGEKGITRADCF